MTVIISFFFPPPSVDQILCKAFFFLKVKNLSGMSDGLPRSSMTLGSSTTTLFLVVVLLVARCGQRVGHRWRGAAPRISGVTTRGTTHHFGRTTSMVPMVVVVLVLVLMLIESRWRQSSSLGLLVLRPIHLQAQTYFFWVFRLKEEIIYLFIFAEVSWIKLEEASPRVIVRLGEVYSAKPTHNVI